MLKAATTTACPSSATQPTCKATTATRAALGAKTVTSSATQPILTVTAVTVSRGTRRTHRMAATARTATDNLSTMDADMNFLDRNPVIAGALVGVAFAVMFYAGVYQ